MIYILRLLTNVGTAFDLRSMTAKSSARIDLDPLLQNIQIGMANSRRVATITQLYEFYQIQSSILSQIALIILSSITVV